MARGNAKKLSVFFLIFAVLLLHLQVTVALRKFWRGQYFGKTFPVQEISNSSQLLDPLMPLWGEQSFEQYVDHFNPRNFDTWKQRYFVNADYYKPGGPVFIMIGGVSETDFNWMKQGAWIQYAKRFNALCFFLEHRYFGKSHPKSNLDTFCMASEHPLGDLSNFIPFINEKYHLSPETKWIAFGGSYGGSLAAWFREKYPHLIHGAISSGAPLQLKLEFKEYYEKVGQILATYSKDCIVSINNGIREINALLNTSMGRKEINEKFNLCDSMEDSTRDDHANFFEMIAEYFANIVQYHNVNSNHSLLTVQETCNLMENNTIGSSVDRLAEINRIFLKADNEKCLDYKYDKMIKELNETSWDSEAAHGARQWKFLTCSEFGLFQTSNEENSLFGRNLPVEFFLNQCHDILGYQRKDVEDGILRKNIYYGGANLETTNVLYVYGSADPWYPAGLTVSNKVHMPVVIINDTGHCADMYEPTSLDKPELTEARKKIENFIKDLIEY